MCASNAATFDTAPAPNTKGRVEEEEEEEEEVVVVVAVAAEGDGKKDEPLTVKAGDTVLYGKYAGTEINVEGNDYLIMRESDIFAIV